jgi:hypothetical protein
MSNFHLFRVWIHFRRYRGRRVPFSSFALPDSFLAVPRASAPVFMLCAPRLGFDGTEGVMSRFQVLRARTRFRRYRGRRLPFSCFARPDSFSTVTWASGPVFMFCVPVLIFGGTEGVGTRFLALCAQTHFGGTEGVGAHFHVLRTRTHFQRYRGRRHKLSCFARSE